MFQRLLATISSPLSSSDDDEAEAASHLYHIDLDLRLARAQLGHVDNPELYPYEVQRYKARLRHICRQMTESKSAAERSMSAAERSLYREALQLRQNELAQARHRLELYTNDTQRFVPYRPHELELGIADYERQREKLIATTPKLLTQSSSSTYYSTASAPSTPTPAFTSQLRHRHVKASIQISIN